MLYTVYFLGGIIVEKLEEKDLESVYGGAHIDLMLFPYGNTADDPRDEDINEFYRVTHVLGYAVYDDKNKYIGGFATGVDDNDVLNATQLAKDNNIYYPEIKISFFRQRNKFCK